MDHTFTDLRAAGAAGDGLADDGAVLQDLLDSGVRHVFIPCGQYKVVRTLRVPSGTHIKADPAACVFISGELPKKRGDFLLTNAHAQIPGEWDTDITLEGGIWDGCFGQGYNDKNTNLFDPDAASGSCLSFVRVRGLTLDHVTIVNSVVYYLRLGEVTDFRITDISFASDRTAYNQDGIHFGGGCRRGLVDGVRVLTTGQTNDDLIAFNADDSVERLENRDLICAPIEDVTVRNVYAADCHCIIRLLSAFSAIRRVRVEHVTAGTRGSAVNVDAARYCRVPITRDDDYPDGVGELVDVVISDFTFWSTRGGSAPMIMAESRPGAGSGLSVDVRRLYDREPENERPTLRARKTPGAAVDLSRAGQADEVIRLDTFAKECVAGDADLTHISIVRSV